MRRVGLCIISVLAFCLLCWGCSKEQTAAPQPTYVKKTPATKPAPVRPEAKQSDEAAPEKYIYNGVGRRDPFENPLRLAPGGSEDEETLTPLQRVELGQLRLVGVIIGRGEPAAMVVGPDGKAYILKKGAKVGKNNGVVVGIDAQGVKIKEKYVDFSGEVRTSDQELQLSKRGGVK